MYIYVLYVYVLTMFMLINIQCLKNTMHILYIRFYLLWIGFSFTKQKQQILWEHADGKLLNKIIMFSKNNKTPTPVCNTM